MVKLHLHASRAFQRVVVTSAMSVLALAALSGTAKANLVVNGGFEDTTLTTSGQLSPTNTTGWSSPTACPGCYNFIYFPGHVTTSDPNGASDPSDPSQPGPNHEVWLYAPGNTGAFPVSPDGGNFLAADAGQTYHAAISQTVTGLVAGDTYDLSFYWGGAQYTTRTGDTTEQWQVSLGSQTQDTVAINDVSESFTGWKQANMVFTATGSSEVLTFLALGSPDGLPPVALLDGVSLTQTPEPGYLATMAIGLGALVFVVRRRSKSANQSV
jgi:hypothetical protein